jgi:hypothetical protein
MQIDRVVPPGQRNHRVGSQQLWLGRGRAECTLTRRIDTTTVYLRLDGQHSSLAPSG